MADDAQTPGEVHVELGPTSAPSYAAIVALRGEHDLATSPEIHAALTPIAGHVLVDLSQCSFMDSAVIGALLGKYQDLQRDGHRLELVVPQSNTAVRRTIELVAIGNLITVHDEAPSSVSERGEPATG
jgi:anti-anti-sigma factor